MGLPSQPGEQALRGGEVPFVRRPVVGPQHLRVGRIALRQVGEFVLEALLRRVGEPGIVFGDPAQASDLVANLVEPPFDDRLERIRTICRGLESLDEAPVHGFEVMQRRIVDRDLDFGGRELALAGFGTEVPRSEGLSGAVLASNPFRQALATGDKVELLVDGFNERVEAGRKVLEALVRHEPAPKGVHDRRGFRDNGHQRVPFAW